MTKSCGKRKRQFTVKIDQVYKYTILLNLLKEKHIEKQKCYCKRQLCHGWFLPHIEGQQNCLFDIAENGIIIKHQIIIYGNQGATGEQREEEITKKQEII